MSTGVFIWSLTAGSNGNIDSAVNFAEGQAPSSVNDAARALMAKIAEWRNDTNGLLSAAGGPTAYTLTANQAFDSLANMNGARIAFTPAVANGASATLNVNGLGAKPLRLSNGVSVPAGYLTGGVPYTAVYDNGGGQWILFGAPPSEFASGTVMLFQQTSAPTGWTKLATHNDKALRIVSGVASSGGSTGFSSVFASRTIALANLPNVTWPSTLSVSDSGHSHGQTGFSAATTTLVSSGATALALTTAQTVNTVTASANVSLSGSVTSGGSGTAMDFAVAFVDVILAQKN